MSSTSRTLLTTKQSVRMQELLSESLSTHLPLYHHDLNSFFQHLLIHLECMNDKLILWHQHNSSTRKLLKVLLPHQRQSCILLHESSLKKTSWTLKFLHAFRIGKTQRGTRFLLKCVWKPMEEHKRSTQSTINSQNSTTRSTSPNVKHVPNSKNEIN